MRDYRKGGRRNWRMIFRDETEFWNPDWLAKLPPGCRIIAAYIYDPGTVTHLCSFEGSSWLEGVSQFIAPPSQEIWDAWREGKDETEIEEICDYFETEYPGSVYGPDCGERGVDTGIRWTKDPALSCHKGEDNAGDAIEALTANGWPETYFMQHPDALL